MSGSFAHAGHWLVNAAYLAPLFILVGVIVRGKLQDQRADRSEET